MSARRLSLLVLALVVGASTPAGAQQARSPAEELAALDERQPVPLLPKMAHHQKQNMRDHLLAIQQIVAAVAVRDFAAAERAAARIGSSPEAERMCSHMGAGAPGFSEKGMQFHRTADLIRDAARRQDVDATLVALSETLATCNSCHGTFRQEVVDPVTWESATSPR